MYSSKRKRNDSEDFIRNSGDTSDDERLNLIKKENIENNIHYDNINIPVTKFSMDNGMKDNTVSQLLPIIKLDNLDPYPNVPNFITLNDFFRWLIFSHCANQLLWFFEDNVDSSSVAIPILFLEIETSTINNDQFTQILLRTRPSALEATIKHVFVEEVKKGLTNSLSSFNGTYLTQLIQQGYVYVNVTIVDVPIHLYSRYLNLLHIPYFPDCAMSMVHPDLNGNIIPILFYVADIPFNMDDFYTLQTPSNLVKSFDTGFGSLEAGIGGIGTNNIQRLGFTRQKVTAQILQWTDILPVLQEDRTKNQYKYGDKGKILRNSDSSLHFNENTNIKTSNDIINNMTNVNELDSQSLLNRTNESISSHTTSSIFPLHSILPPPKAIQTATIHHNILSSSFLPPSSPPPVILTPNTYYVATGYLDLQFDFSNLNTNINTNTNTNTNTNNFNVRSNSNSTTGTYTKTESIGNLSTGVGKLINNGTNIGSQMIGNTHVYLSSLTPIALERILPQQLFNYYLPSNDYNTFSDFSKLSGFSTFSGMPPQNCDGHVLLSLTQLAQNFGLHLMPGNNMIRTKLCLLLCLVSAQSKTLIEHTQKYAKQLKLEKEQDIKEKLQIVKMEKKEGVSESNDFSLLNEYNEGVANVVDNSDQEVDEFFDNFTKYYNNSEDNLEFSHNTLLNTYSGNTDITSNNNRDNFNIITSSNNVISHNNRNMQVSVPTGINRFDTIDSEHVWGRGNNSVFHSGDPNNSSSFSFDTTTNNINTSSFNNSGSDNTSNRYTSTNNMKVEDDEDSLDDLAEFNPTNTNLNMIIHDSFDDPTLSKLLYFVSNVAKCHYYFNPSGEEKRNLLKSDEFECISLLQPKKSDIDFCVSMCIREHRNFHKEKERVSVYFDRDSYENEDVGDFAGSFGFTGVIRLCDTDDYVNSNNTKVSRNQHSRLFSDIDDVLGKSTLNPKKEEIMKKLSVCDINCKTSDDDLRLLMQIDHILEDDQMVIHKNRNSLSNNVDSYCLHSSYDRGYLPNHGLSNNTMVNTNLSDTSIIKPSYSLPIPNRSLIEHNELELKNYYQNNDISTQNLIKPYLSPYNPIIDTNKSTNNNDNQNNEHTISFESSQLLYWRVYILYSRLLSVSLIRNAGILLYNYVLASRKLGHTSSITIHTLVCLSLNLARLQHKDCANVTEVIIAIMLVEESNSVERGSGSVNLDISWDKEDNLSILSNSTLSEYDVQKKLEMFYFKILDFIKQAHHTDNTRYGYNRRGNIDNMVV